MHRRMWFLYASWNTILLYLRASPRVRHLRRGIHLRQDVDLHVWKWRRGGPRGRLCRDVVRVNHTNRKGIQILRQLRPRRMRQLRKGVPRLLLLDARAPKWRRRKTLLPTLHQASSWHRLPRLRAGSQDNWRISGRLKALIWVLFRVMVAHRVHVSFIFSESFMAWMIHGNPMTSESYDLNFVIGFMRGMLRIISETHTTPSSEHLIYSQI